jgi:futalosine hydrolase
MHKPSILIVVPTMLEANQLFPEKSLNPAVNLHSLHQGNVNVDLLISGVGLTFTTHSLTKQLARKTYHFAVMAGVAGSFEKEIPLTTVFQVVSESFSDLGVVSLQGFASVFDTKLVLPQQIPFNDGLLYNYSLINNQAIMQLPTTQGHSVNLLHQPMAKYQDHFKGLESMEGAAFFYVCLHEKLPFVELRAVSNYVGESDKSQWKIKEAIEQLRHTIEQMLSELLV